MRSLRTATAALLVVALGATPALACEETDRHDPARSADVTPALGWQTLLYGDAMQQVARAARRVAERTERAKPKPRDLSAYKGLASWVDIFNHGPWRNPRRAVKRMDERGAKAIFLQTSTYGQSKALHDRDAIDKYLYHAHRRGMKVVAWYVPTFNQQGIDFARSKRAIRYRSPSGDRFDSFGLDIEAEHVRDIRVRNERLIKLSKRLRRVAGPSYPLSAITPDPVVANYWPNFPYKAIGKIYDVIVPMGYWTFRARGFKQVHEYTSKGVKNIQRATGKKDVPIHFIGGIADDAKPSDLRGFTKAAREHDLIGASLYDYPITDRRSWYEMRALSEEVARHRRQKAAAERKAEAERQRVVRRKRWRERVEARERAKDRAGSKRSKKAKGPKKKPKGSGKATHDDGKRNKRASRSRAGKRAKDSRRKNARKARERRRYSSSASRPGSRSGGAGGRERPRLRVRDLSLQRF